jgi:TatD DNase family protein
LRRILQGHWPAVDPGGVLHCFSGEREDAFHFIERGFLISFAGSITFKKADRVRAVARSIPLDRLLAETDCPYLAPVPYRGKRNEPAYVHEVTRALAALHGQSEEDVESQLLRNFAALFRLG